MGGISKGGRGGEKLRGNMGTYTVNAINASMLTMVHLKGVAHSSGFSTSPRGSKSMMVVLAMSAAS